MVGWHHRLDGHGFGWTPGDGDGQGGLACCRSWGHKESHDWVTELNWTEQGKQREQAGGCLRWPLACEPEATPSTSKAKGLIYVIFRTETHPAFCFSVQQPIPRVSVFSASQDNASLFPKCFNMLYSYQQCFLSLMFGEIELPDFCPWSGYKISHCGLYLHCLQPIALDEHLFMCFFSIPISCFLICLFMSFSQLVLRFSY